MAVMRYLDSVGYQPTLGWDPLTGKIVQFMPSTRSAKALKNRAGGVETNRYGSVHIQIEAFFTPGMVVDGKRYPELTDTPMIGLEKILAWTDHLGIPRVWATPRGSRSVTDWKTKAGHRAHYNVPENDHTDIVGADVRKLLMIGRPTPPSTTSGVLIVNDNDRREIRTILQQELRTILGNANADVDADPTHYALADVQRDLNGLKVIVEDLANLVANAVPLEQPVPEPVAPE